MFPHFQYYGTIESNASEYRGDRLPLKRPETI